MEYKYKVSCSKNKLGEVREFLQKVLIENAVPEVTVNSLVLAVDEVCANLIIHSHHCNPDEHIDLRVKVERPHGITFFITDKGEGFNITNYEEPLLSDIIQQKRKGGMGLMLVKRIMDEIEYTSDKKKNVYRFHKNI